MLCYVIIELISEDDENDTPAPTSVDKNSEFLGSALASFVICAD